MLYLVEGSYWNDGRAVGIGDSLDEAKRIAREHHLKNFHFDEYENREPWLHYEKKYPINDEKEFDLNKFYLKIEEWEYLISEIELNTVLNN